jgi:hypothetical protein
VAWLRARAAAHRSEAARLDAEADAALAARAAGVSPWGSRLPPLFLRQLLELLQWDPAVCGTIRLVCFTWASIHDALRPWLQPRRSLAVMERKLCWFASVTEVDLTCCENGVCGPLVELGGVPSLRSLLLPASCAERAVDAEAVCGLTTLTTLSFLGEVHEDTGEPLGAGEWVLDLSRLKTAHLELWSCSAVTDKEVLALSHVAGLTSLNLYRCDNVSSEGLRAVSSLTALTTLNFDNCDNVSSEVLRAVSSLTALTTLHLQLCFNVTDVGLYAVSRLSALTTLNLRHCLNVTDEGLRELRRLFFLSTLNLSYCPNVTAAGKLALQAALPNLTIHDYQW